MRQGKEDIQWFLFGETRESLNLIETEGKTFPHGNSTFPKIFRKPLKVSDGGGIKGWKSKAWKSGGRSALVSYKRKWYDIEGVSPSEKEWESGIPEGGDTKEEAKKELDIGALFFNYGQKNHVEAVMKPVCFFEYSKIQFKGKPVYAAVLETKGDLRLSHFLGEYLTVASKAFERLKNDPSKEAKIERITNEIKGELTNKIGQWTGFWYRCLDENKLLWGTSYVKNPDGTYNVYSSAGNNNLTAYRTNQKVAVGIVDLDGCKISNQKKLKDLEIDRIKKRLSIFEVALHLLKHGRSAVNMSQYQTLQTVASRLYTQITPPKGIDYYQEVIGRDFLQEFNLPVQEELDIIRYFNEGRNGIKPEFIEERYITSIKKAFLA